MRTLADNVYAVGVQHWDRRLFDELIFMYLAGSRGVNTGFIFPTSYTGFAGNAFAAPDTEHLLHGGNATVKGDLDSADTMDVTLIERAKTRATVMGGGTEETPQIQPIMIDGEEHFVAVMHPWQAYTMRTAAGAGNWLEIQKSAATSEGRNSPIFKGGMGMHDSVVLHSHKNVIRFDDYGSGSNVTAARALFLGSQAAVCAFGSPGTGLRFDWNEEMQDRGNQVVITTGSIFGVKKTRFNSKDFGVIALDTAAADPT